jgi:hypothetical protein
LHIGYLNYQNVQAGIRATRSGNRHDAATMSIGWTGNCRERNDILCRIDRVQREDVDLMRRVIVTALATCLWGAAALAQTASLPSPMPAESKSAVSGYYVEFRAADMGVYGHSYIAFGKLSAGGRPLTVQYADFHPRGGEIGLAVGHVVPVAAGMQPEPEVLKLPLTSVWRKPISATDYRKLTAAVAAARANPKVWSAIAYNCNSFVGDMAEAIGLKSPPSLLFSTSYIPALMSLNSAAKDDRQAASKPTPRTKRSQPAPAIRPST